MSWITVTIIIFIYLFFILFLGTSAGRGRESSVVEYIAASRSLGFFVMYFLMGGAIFSAFAYLGGPGWAYSKGAASFYILGYCALGLVPWWLWGPRALRAGKKYHYVTQAQLFTDRFQSKALSVIIAIVSILAFIQYITLQMKGSAYVFEVASGGRIPFWAGALIAYVVVVIYVFYGGVRGVAWTNVFQGAFMITIAWILGLYFAYKLYGGPAEMFRQIMEAKPTHLLVGPGTKMSFAGFSSALLVSVLGFAMWPHLFMKAYTAQSERVLKQTIVMYPTFAIFMIPVLFIGFAGMMQVTPDVLGGIRGSLISGGHFWWPDIGFATARGLRLYCSAASVGCNNIFLAEGNKSRCNLRIACGRAVQLWDCAPYYPEVLGYPCRNTRPGP